jgi:hypothetical protein
MAGVVLGPSVFIRTTIGSVCPLMIEMCTNLFDTIPVRLQVIQLHCRGDTCDHTAAIHVIIMRMPRLSAIVLDAM